MIETCNVLGVLPTERAHIKNLREQFVSVRLRFGFMETPNVNWVLAQLRGQGLRITGMKTTIFLGRCKLVPHPDVGMPSWQDLL